MEQRLAERARTDQDAEVRRGVSSWGAVLTVPALLAVVVGLLVTVFAWPATRAALHDVPLAVTGPAPAVEQVVQRLEAAQPGAFAVTALPDADAARTAIREREVYGAVVVDPAAGPVPQVLTASAASPAVAQALSQLATGLAAEQTGQPPVAVQDVVPAAPGDPRGAGLAAAVLPTVLGGLLTALVVRERVRGRGHRVVALLAGAVAAGAAAAVVLHTWLDAVGGSWWETAAVLSLGVGAVAATVLGLRELLGVPGAALGAATMVLVGNPFAGVAVPPQMLPGSWGELGQMLPPGATGSLLRSVAFFDGAGAADPLVVLGAWLLGGLALVAAAQGRNRLVP